MDPFSKNTKKLKENVKKIKKLKKGTRIIIDDDVADKVEIATSKPTINAGDDIFSETKAFDILDITTPQDTKQEEEQEEIKYTSENVMFNIKSALENNFDKLQENIDSIVTPTTKILYYNVCYTIRYDAKIPYLMYYLFKYPKSEVQTTSSDMFIFPFKSYKVDGRSKTLLEQSISLNQSLFSRSQRQQINKVPDGYIFNSEKKSVYMFYEFNFNKDLFEPSYLNRKQQFWWCLIDELVNYKKVLNFPVSNNVYDLLIDNEDLIRLYHTKNKQIKILETPSVGYHGTYYELLPLIISFGLRPSSLYPMMGPYYYFGTFRKAVRYAGWTSTYKPRKIGDKFIADKNGLYERGGIVRFALFLGKMKVFLNLPYDDKDYSDRYLNRIKENPQDKKYEDLTLKLHDHNGKWTENHDSAYVGRVRLGNGGLFMKNPEFITQKFNQQYTLSYHELDKDTLVYDARRKNVKWDPNFENYHIK